MKHLILFFIIFSLIQQQAYSQTLSCSVSQSEVDALSLVAGSQRLGLLSTSATILETPNAAILVGDPANSQSVYMYSVSEALSAVGFTNNELQNSTKNGTLNTRCNSAAAIEEMKAAGNIQLFAHSCTIYELINRLVNLMAESDMIEQQNIESKTALNQAIAENTKRDAEIKVEKTNIEEANKLLKTALDEMDKAKKAYNTAKDATKAALAALENATKAAANCEDNCDGANAAIAAASKAVDDATKAEEKAKKSLETSVKKLVDVLVNKMGAETSAVLAILQGTVKGTSEGQDVQFKIVGKEFTLIDLGSTISSLTGEPKDKASAFVSGEAGDKTTGFFTGLIKEYERTVTYADEIAKREADIIANNNGIKPVGLGDMTSAILATDTSGLLGLFNSSYMNMNSPDKTTTAQIMNSFAGSVNGADYVETLALAIKDYTADKKDKGVTNLEAMKTPATRIDELTRQYDARQALTNTTKPMIEKTLCYLDQALKVFKEFYKEATKTTTIKEPLFIYVNAFTSDKLKQKNNEGYFSSVNYRGIQAEFACYALGGDSTTCKKATLAAEGSASNSCFWSGPVIGPSEPMKDLCDKTKVGVIGTNTSGNKLTCKCM